MGHMNLEHRRELCGKDLRGDRVAWIRQGKMRRCCRNGLTDTLAKEGKLGVYNSKESFAREVLRRSHSWKLCHPCLDLARRYEDEPSREPKRARVRREHAQGTGWISFIVAGLVFVVGYSIAAGHPPGMAGAMEWWAIAILFVPWGAIDTAIKAIFRKSG